MNELVSVIITTHNNPVALLSSLPSVIHQSYKNLEILVVDGGQNKHTLRAVDMFDDKRITYVKVGDGNSDNRICGNVQYRRNTGVALAQGKYVAMLDVGDIWHKDKIEEQIKLAEYFHASLVGCYTYKISGRHLMTDKPPIIPSYKDLLQAFNFSQTSAYFMNKKDLMDCGGFNEELRSMHEYDVALRMAKDDNMLIFTVHKPLLISHCDNVTKRKYYFIKIAELLDLWRCYGNDMLKYLTPKQFFTNIIKTVALVTLYIAGYIAKEKVWRVIFKLKEWYQK